jgi:DNA-binding MarR family transcriptional regulator
MPEPVATTNRPISFLVPQIMLTMKSTLQTTMGSRSDLSGLEVRMIGELDEYGELTMTSLVEIVGNDKSQVSQALRRLLIRKIIRRDALRAPLSLTPQGKAISQKLAAGARHDYQALFKGFRRQEQDQFMSGLWSVTQAAAQLLDEERRLDAQHTTSNKPQRIYNNKFAALSGVMLPEMAPKRLVALATLLRRSSFLAFKRLTGLPNNASIVLVCVWDYAPVTAKHLSELTGRAKGRIERDAAQLTKLELIQRGKSLASHDWIFDRAEAASAACKKLAAEISRREQRLIQDFTEPEHKVFRSLLARAASNAAAMDAKRRARN